MKTTTQQLMVNEIADWQHRSLIDASTQKILSAPYHRSGQLLASVLQWLAVGALLLVGMAVVGVISVFNYSLTLGAMLFFTVGVLLWCIGVCMARDPSKRMPVTGIAVVTIGLMLISGSVLLAGIVREGAGFYGLSGEGGHGLVAQALLITTLLSMTTAYWFGLRWPLLLGLICAFHGLGAAEHYDGGGSYYFDIKNPQIMTIVAGLSALFGLWHQHEEDLGEFRRFSGFGRLYVIVGLLYFNCSLWFLSLPIYDMSRSGLSILTFTLATIGQLVVGARFKHPGFTGFGVVFLVINLYTRFYEQSWDHLSAAAFFAAAGTAGVVLGGLFERAAIRGREIT